VPDQEKNISRSLLHIAIPLVITIVSIGGLASMQRHVDALRESDLNNELLYFPNDRLLRYLAAGQENVIADFLWYRTVQYTAKEFGSEEHKFEWLEHMINIVTALDPHNIDAYRFGGLFLALIGADDLGIPILEDGFRNNPQSWEMPYELHTVYLMKGDEDPEFRILASKYALLVAERHEERYKKRYLELAENILSGGDLHEEAIEMLKDAVEEASDPFLRKQSEFQLLMAYIKRNLSVLRETSEQFKEINGREIQSLEELVDAGLINALPANPDEGEYFVDAEGRILNMTFVADRDSRTRNRIRRHIAEFREENGRNPSGIDELLAYRKTDIPYEILLLNVEWVYDPNSDTLSVVEKEGL
jgi:hypothetical protein